MANQCLGELGQALCDAGLVHDLTGEDEQGHGEEGKQVQTGKIALRCHGQHGCTADLQDAENA